MSGVSYSLPHTSLQCDVWTKGLIRYLHLRISLYLNSECTNIAVMTSFHQTRMSPANFEFLNSGSAWLESQPEHHPPRYKRFCLLVPKANVCKMKHAKVTSISVNLNSSNLYSRYSVFKLDSTGEITAGSRSQLF